MGMFILILLAIVVIIASVLYFAFEVTESQKNKVVFSDATMPKMVVKTKRKTKAQKAQTLNDYNSFWL